MTTLNLSAPARHRVLVIEDEAPLLEAMVTYLNMEGLVADGVGSLGAAQQWMATHEFDVLVLDLGLPDGDSLTWLATQALPQNKGIIITTARGESTHRIAGARAGADAYLVKPVALEELASLILNVARRLQKEAPPTWLLHATHWQLVSPQGVPLKLTHSEMAVLGLLAAAPGKAVARDALVVGLGQDPDSYDPRRMEILMRRLRAKALATLGQALPVATVHRQGYAFTALIQVVGGA